MGSYEQDSAFLGQKGPFFVRLLLLLNAVFISSGLHGLFFVFVGATPAHRCREEGETNVFLSETSVFLGPDEARCRRPRNTTDLRLSALEPNRSLVPLEECVDGWSYSTEIYSSTIVSEWDLVCDSEWKVPFTSSTLYMGYLLGSLVSGQLSDRFGRKKVLFVSLGAEALAMFAQSFSQSWLLFCVLYFFVGAFQISIYITAFVLGSEVLSSSLRVLFTALGAFLHYCVGYMLLPWIAFALRDWRPLLRLLSAITLVYIPFWWLIPESPRWLLSQGRVCEAESIVRDAAQKNRVTAPERIFSQPEVKQSSSQKFNALDVLKNSKIRQTTLLCLLLWMSINIGYFGLSLNTSNLSGDPFLNCFLSAVTEVPAYISSTVLLKVSPRRTLMSTVLILGGALLLLRPLIPHDLQVLALALEMAGKFSFTMSFTVIYIYTAELYPTVLRNMGFGVCSSAARIGSITAPYVIFLGSFNKYLPYLVMGSLTVASSLTAVFLPETFGKLLPETLEEMQKCRSFFKRDKQALEKERGAVDSKEEKV